MCCVGCCLMCCIQERVLDGILGSNLEASGNSDSNELSIPIFELMEGKPGMGLNELHGHGV